MDITEKLIEGCSPYIGNMVYDIDVRMLFIELFDDPKQQNGKKLWPEPQPQPECQLQGQHNVGQHDQFPANLMRTVSKSRGMSPRGDRL